MRVLVTGASGFLGRAVAAAVRDAGHDVTTFQRRPSGLVGTAGPAGGSGAGSESVPGGDARIAGGLEDRLGSVTSAADVDAAVSGADAVVHLAAKVSLAGDPRDFERVNVEGTRTLLAAARAAGVSRFVFVSSPSVAHAGTSIVGDDALPASPSSARGEYARTKARAEQLALAADAPDLRVVAVRPHLVWGPGDTQLVERIVDRARRRRLPLLDHGVALIDTTYIDNAASAMVAALERVDAVHGNAYVVTNGEPRPVAELLAGICAAAGVPAPAWSVPAGVARGAGSLVERLWALRRTSEAGTAGAGDSGAGAGAGAGASGFGSGLGSAATGATASRAGASGAVPGASGAGGSEPPMTRFLAEQLSTAHWFDQRRTRADLRWHPTVSLDEGLRRLAASYR